MSSEKILLVTFLGVIIFICVLVGFIYLILLLHQRKKQTYQRGLELLKTQYEREALRSQVEVHEQTLEQISRDLHDNIGHYVTLAKLYLNTIGDELGEIGARKVEHAVDLLTKSLEDMRDLSRSLSLDLIHTAGLPEAIAKQVEKLENASHFRISFRIFGNYQYLDEQKEIILFRILQEAISNVVRHAKANSIAITLECTTISVVLIIQDDGLGFVVEDLFEKDKPSKHIGGLSNMRARAQLINAIFVIESELGHGTRVRISIPYNNTYSKIDG
ncbi:MAG: histidine kinase [Puia sp.]|nr:histidine kinase [Puia sp.]